MNGYTTANNKFDLPVSQDFLELDYGRSINFNWNIFEKDIKIYKHYVQLVTGLGVGWNHYTFSNNTTLNPNLPYVSYTTDSLINYKKNKLNMTYLNVPLMIGFNTNNKNADHSLRISGGILFGYRIGNAKTKQKYEKDNQHYKLVWKDDFNLAPFKYSATVRAGYGDFTIFVNYGLSEFFKTGKGNPRVYPVEAGIALNF